MNAVVLTEKYNKVSDVYPCSIDISEHEACWFCAACKTLTLSLCARRNVSDSKSGTFTLEFTGTQHIHWAELKKYRSLDREQNSCAQSVFSQQVKIHLC